jgi:hypothetical protein
MNRLPSFCLVLALCAACAPSAGTPLPVVEAATEPALPPSPLAPAAGTATAAPTRVGGAGQAPSGFSILLGWPTTDSITAFLLCLTNQQVAIAYGTTPGVYTAQTAPVTLQANIPQDIEITALQPDSAYYYTVLFNGAASGEHSFHTQRPAGATFTFTIDADPHNGEPNSNMQLFAVTLGNALAEHPDFNLDLGDTFMTEKRKAVSYAEAEPTYAEMRSAFSLLGPDVPLFLVSGNHDGEQGWMLPTSQVPVWSAQLRQLYFPGPIPYGFYSGATEPDPTLGSRRDAYYAWTWGDALFVVLDPYWYTASKASPNDPDSNWSKTLGRAQYDWLKTTLQSSQATFKFIFIHSLVGGRDKDWRGGIEAASYYEWGGNNADGSYGFDAQRPGWGLPIHQLLVQNHVTAVFHGHDHIFVRQELDGIIYQELPQPDVVNGNPNLAADYGYIHGDVVPSSGHLRVTVSPQQVTVDYIRSYLPQDENASRQNGQVDYTYTVIPR